ncbi:restriction endonuclease [Myxococcus sp. 1LA]
MANIRTIDLLALDSIFNMKSGYVLNFSNRTMAVFFAEELNIDIDDPSYQKLGTSKANRLRCFLQSADSNTAVQTLKALWNYREGVRKEYDQEETLPNAHGRLLEIIDRIQKGPASGRPPVAAGFDRIKTAQLRTDLANLKKLPPHPRGLAFEKFLKDLFNAYNLEPHDAFRLEGEQIDGSFLLGTDIYLLEAKWHEAPIGNADLHAFHGKLDQKAVWTRGLFISYSGFTTVGLNAFGRAKRVICMDGADLQDTLVREIPLNHVLAKKVRHASETGEPFARTCVLFPR